MVGADRLESDDLVFWPTFDGGYLIGMRGQGPYDALEGARMSVGTQLDGIVARLLGLSVGLLEATFDVGVEKDLPATGDTLESHGLMEQHITVASRSHHAPSLPWEPMGGSRRKPYCP